MVHNAANFLSKINGCTSKFQQKLKGCQTGVLHRSSRSSALQSVTCNGKVAVRRSQSTQGEGSRPVGTPRKGLQGPELTPPPSPSKHHTPPCHQHCPLHKECSGVSSRHMPFLRCRATRHEHGLMSCCLSAHTFWTAPDIKHRAQYTCCISVCHTCSSPRHQAQGTVYMLCICMLTLVAALNIKHRAQYTCCISVCRACRFHLEQSDAGSLSVGLWQQPFPSGAS